MEYRKFETCLVVRLDRGEEIGESLREIARREPILFATVQGIGAVGECAFGVYRIAEKRYEVNVFSGDFEIVSLAGTVMRQGNEPYLHLHMSVGDQSGKVFGGHLDRAVVSATSEIVLSLLPAQVSRRADKVTGLNLIDFGQIPEDCSHEDR